jgi:hypothetical protein
VAPLYPGANNLPARGLEVVDVSGGDRVYDGPAEEHLCIAEGGTNPGSVANFGADKLVGWKSMPITPNNPFKGASTLEK